MNETQDKNPGDIPVLLDVVDDPTPAESAPPPPDEPLLDEDKLAELQTELSSRSFELTDQLLHSAFQEMEAALFEQVSNRLRKELPELVDRILREHLDVASDD